MPVSILCCFLFLVGPTFLCILLLIRPVLADVIALVVEALLVTFLGAPCLGALPAKGGT